jgi:hypothetical protein
VTIRVECPCSWSFDASDDLAGGLANCPSCGRAAEVPGLRDPLWRLIQVGAAIVVVGAAAYAWSQAGPAAAFAVAAVLGALLWLLSRAF